MTSCLALIGLFVVVRLTLLLVYVKLTGSQEVASDVHYHMLIINDPLGILLGRATEIASYPPFQWLIEWPVFSFFNQVFSDVVSIRLLMMTVELSAFVLLLFHGQRIFKSKTLFLVCISLFIISPHQYLASVFFVQEDVISQLFMLLGVLFLLNQYRLAAIITFVAGVLIAKIFFIIPLFYIIMFSGNTTFLKRIATGVLAVLPIAAIYTLSISNALNQGGEVPIRDFTPDAAYGANFWTLILKSYPDLLVAVKNSSLALSVLFQLGAIVTLFALYRNRAQDLHPVLLATVPLALFFATFYNHMPEYFLMLWPLVAIYCTGALQQLVLAVIFSLAWAPRILHGLQTIKDNFGSTVQARSEIFEPFFQAIAINPDKLNDIALIAHSLIYTAFFVVLAIAAFRHQRRLNSGLQ